LQPPSRSHRKQLHCPPVPQPGHDGASASDDGPVTLN
jgi:hypothetical protein